MAQPPAAAADGPTAEEVANESEVPERLSRARAQFQKGVELAKQRQFAGAAARFRAALDIHPAPTVEYNLAAALYELQQYEESYNRCQRVLQDPSSPEPLKERASALEKSLYPHVARLTVVASSAANDLTVQLDGAPLNSSLLGVPQAVRPGPHTVIADRAGSKLAERNVDVPLSTAAIVDVSLIVAEQKAEAGDTSRNVVVGAPAPQKDQPNARRKRILMWSGIALGVVAVGVGVGVALAKREPKTEAPLAGDFQPGVLTWR